MYHNTIGFGKRRIEFLSDCQLHVVKEALIEIVDIQVLKGCLCNFRQKWQQIGTDGLGVAIETILEQRRKFGEKCLANVQWNEPTNIKLYYWNSLIVDPRSYQST